MFFAQSIADGKAGAEIQTFEAGANAISPYTISGLEAGTEYFVYAVITNDGYASAETVSASVSMRATAGE
ncbi:MAG: hypothetical protein JW864_02035 [Spirochaetes bacterium]|nr:hypothetical protein [Spirochaetota bacterium]